jgi:hypothetical protein
MIMFERSIIAKGESITLTSYNYGNAYSIKSDNLEIYIFIDEKDCKIEEEYENLLTFTKYKGMTVDKILFFLAECYMDYNYAKNDIVYLD